MRRYAVKLALAASLTLVGVVHATEQDAITTQSISRARSVGELHSKGEFDATNSVRAGFGFSPFLEEGLVGEVPPARHYEFQPPSPAYLREFHRVVDLP